MNKIFKNFSIVAVIMIFSKIFGFFRDAIISYNYGASSITDAFNIIQFLPNFLFLVLQQAVAVGFIPVFLALKKESKDKANAFVTTSIILLTFISSLLCLILFLFPDFFIRMFASGFDSETTKIAVTMLQLSCWSLLLQSIVLVLAAYLNALKKFIFPALLGFALDITFLLALGLSKIFDNPILLGLGPLLNMILQSTFLLTVSFKNNYRVKIQFNETYKKFFEMIVISLPSIIALGITQINYFVDKNISSNYPVGSISSLSLSTNIVNAVESVIVASLATVLYTEFSKLQTESKSKESIALLNSVAEKIMAFLIPLSIFFFACSEPIVKLLYGHGSFTYESVIITSNCFKFYALSMPFIGLNLIITRYFYSIKKSIYVVISSSIGLLVNMIGDVIVWKFTSFGVETLALVTSFSIFANFICLFIFLNKKCYNVYINMNMVLVCYGISFIAFVFCMIPIKVFGLLWHGIVSIIIGVMVFGIIYVVLYLMYCKKNIITHYRFFVSAKQKLKNLIKKLTKK